MCKYGGKIFKASTKKWEVCKRIVSNNDQAILSSNIEVHRMVQILQQQQQQQQSAQSVL